MQYSNYLHRIYIAFRYFKSSRDYLKGPGGYAQVKSIYNTILYKEIEHLQILVSAGDSYDQTPMDTEG